jgi:PAS domain S-box-containing protein
LKKAAEDDRQRKMEDEKQVWATRGLAKFNDILRQDTGNINLLSYSIIKNLVDFLNANQGGIFIFNDDDNTDLHLQLVACYAYNKQKRLNKKIKLREGLVGTCAVEKATTYIKQVPHNYINITSGLGKATPQSLLLVPLVLNELIFGVIEIASLNNFQEHEIKFVEKLSENVAATLSLVKTNERTNRLLTQFQLQSEDLAAKEEEMRQNLEELQSIQENLTNQQNYMNDLRYALDNAIIEAEFEPGGTVLRINKRFTESTGYTEKELLGEKIFIIIYGKEKDTFEHLWDNLLLGLPYKGIMKTKVKNGKERWYHANYTPVLNEVGKVYKIFYMAQDITDIKRLELELYDREASLEIKLKRLETEVNILKKELEIHSTKKITQRI